MIPQILKNLSILCLIMLAFTLKSVAIQAYINHSVFKNDEKSSFVELQIKIPVSSIIFAHTEEGKHFASLYIELSYKQDDSVYIFDNFYLETPELESTKNLNFALLDLKRYQLPFGEYLFKIKINDRNNDGDHVKFESLLNTSFSNVLLEISDIIVADTIYTTSSENQFSRHNIDVIPNVFSSLTKNQNLHLYFEVYNAVNMLLNKKSFYIEYSIKKDSILYPDLGRTRRYEPSQQNIIAERLDISTLDFGSYFLNIKIISPTNQTLAKKTISFNIKDDALKPNASMTKLVNSYSNAQLRQYVEYLYYKADKDELKKSSLLLAKDDIEAMKTFMVEFWTMQNQDNPEDEWLAYLKLVEESNEMFSTQMRKGYLTDRGRVYIEYGPPNDVTESSNPSISYPYQIWHYYKLNDRQSNKRFIFFNKTGALQEFELLHSDATGEVKNLNWQKVIKKFNKNEGSIFGDFLENDFNQ